MALSPFYRAQLHTWGRFRREDGRGHTWAFCCWALTPQLPVAGHWHSEPGPLCYALPMDDERDHWLRLEAEAWARDHHDPQIQPHGAPHGLVHTGGVVHPEWPHITLGGHLAWEHDPHPVVQQRLDWLRSLDFEGLVTHLCGPADQVFKGVIASDR